MANKFYPKGAQKILTGQIDFDVDGIAAALIPSGYTYSESHEFLSEVGPLVGAAVLLEGKSTFSGVFDAADVAFGALAPGSTVKALVLFKGSGNPSTSPLLCYLDDVTGFPFATNGGEVSVPWSNGAARILSLV